MLNDVFMAIKEKTGMAPFNALDKVMDQMSLTTDFNRQLKHCVEAVATYSHATRVKTT
jgi:hypothetical protein